MQNFEYCTPTRIIFGQGVIAKLPEVLGRIGPERIGEMAHHVAVNEGLEHAYVPLHKKDIEEILSASL